MKQTHGRWPDTTARAGWMSDVDVPQPAPDVVPMPPPPPPRETPPEIIEPPLPGPPSPVREPPVVPHPVRAFAPWGRRCGAVTQPLARL